MSFARSDAAGHSPRRGLNQAAPFRSLSAASLSTSALSTSTSAAARRVGGIPNFPNSFAMSPTSTAASTNGGAAMTSGNSNGSNYNSNNNNNSSNNNNNNSNSNSSPAAVGGANTPQPGGAGDKRPQGASPIRPRRHNGSGTFKGGQGNGMTTANSAPSAMAVRTTSSGSLRGSRGPGSETDKARAILAAFTAPPPADANNNNNNNASAGPMRPRRTSGSASLSPSPSSSRRRVAGGGGGGGGGGGSGGGGSTTIGPPLHGAGGGGSNGQYTNYYSNTGVSNTPPMPALHNAFAAPQQQQQQQQQQRSQQNQQNYPQQSSPASSPPVPAPPPASPTQHDDEDFEAAGLHLVDPEDTAVPGPKSPASIEEVFRSIVEQQVAELNRSLEASIEERFVAFRKSIERDCATAAATAAVELMQVEGFTKKDKDQEELESQPELRQSLKEAEARIRHLEAVVASQDCRLGGCERELASVRDDISQHDKQLQCHAADIIHSQEKINFEEQHLRRVASELYMDLYGPHSDIMKAQNDLFSSLQELRDRLASPGMASSFPRESDEDHQKRMQDLEHAEIRIREELAAITEAAVNDLQNAAFQHFEDLRCIKDALQREHRTLLSHLSSHPMTFVSTHQTASKLPSEQPPLSPVKASPFDCRPDYPSPTDPPKLHEVSYNNTSNNNTTKNIKNNDAPTGWGTREEAEIDTFIAQCGESVGIAEETHLEAQY